MTFAGNTPGSIPHAVYVKEQQQVDKIRKVIRRNNWSLESEHTSGRGGHWERKYLIIRLDRRDPSFLHKNLSFLQESGQKVVGMYPGRYGPNKISGKITELKQTAVRIGNPWFAIRKFLDLYIKIEYAHITHRDTDD